MVKFVAPSSVSFQPPCGLGGGALTEREHDLYVRVTDIAVPNPPPIWVVNRHLSNLTLAARTRSNRYNRPQRSRWARLAVRFSRPSCSERLVGSRDDRAR